MARSSTGAEGDPSVRLRAWMRSKGFIAAGGGWAGRNNSGAGEKGPGCNGGRDGSPGGAKFADPGPGWNGVLAGLPSDGDRANPGKAGIPAAGLEGAGAIGTIAGGAEAVGSWDSADAGMSSVVPCSGGREARGVGWAGGGTAKPANGLAPMPGLVGVDIHEGAPAFPVAGPIWDGVGGTNGAGSAGAAGPNGEFTAGGSGIGEGAAAGVGAKGAPPDQRGFDC
ncbi:hypothetical protein DES53_11440 [Roseimicrobium gellanilyticum]|uniref:Uncharacterized protein n=1 Tax=Roseimicrobium gellanilyticum TaxID=748857 RepID=A0A366H5U8_9BACT|nr:hypothetical protein DES53_11440 [Roseimicrobium gellanilyticum]